MGKIMHGGIEYSGGGSGGGGGSTVTITPTLSTGTKIADFEIDGTAGELYAPQGGGGGGYTRTELFKSSTNLAVWDASGITLSDDIENYDEIEFVLAFASGTDMSKRTNKFGAKWFTDYCAYTSAAASADHALLLLWPNQGFSAAWDSANKKIMLWGRNGSAGMFAVYGIKY